MEGCRYVSEFLGLTLRTLSVKTIRTPDGVHRIFLPRKHSKENKKKQTKGVFALKHNTKSYRILGCIELACPWAAHLGANPSRIYKTLYKQQKIRNTERFMDFIVESNKSDFDFIFSIGNLEILSLRAISAKGWLANIGARYGPLAPFHGRLHPIQVRSGLHANGEPVVGAGAKRIICTQLLFTCGRNWQTKLNVSSTRRHPILSMIPDLRTCNTHEVWIPKYVVDGPRDEYQKDATIANVEHTDAQVKR